VQQNRALDNTIFQVPNQFLLDLISRRFQTNQCLIGAIGDGARTGCIEIKRNDIRTLQRIGLTRGQKRQASFLGKNKLPRGSAVVSNEASKMA